MSVSTSGALDDGFTLDRFAALDFPAVRPSSRAVILPTSSDVTLPEAGPLATLMDLSNITETEATPRADGLHPGCPRLIEHRPNELTPGDSPIVFRG